MQPGSSYPGSSYGDPTRANDAERADICAILDNAYSDGELDGDEHRQRTATAMSAKTRGQLLGLISDLQVRAPVFSPPPVTAVKTNPGRNWIIGAATAGALAAAALVGVVIVWHNGASSSPVSAPTAAVAAPTARVAAPTPAVAAPTTVVGAPRETFNSDGAGAFLPEIDVVGTVSGDFQDNYGHAPEHVTCPGDLPGRLGAFERCSIADMGKRYDADVTVTAANGNRISTHESINEVGPPPPPN